MDMIINPSPAQQRWLKIWKHKVPLSYCVVQLSDEVDLSLIEDRVMQLVRSNDILRTVLSDTLHNIFETLSMEKGDELYDLQSLSTEIEPGELIELWKQQSWNLNTGPLLRLRILKKMSGSFFVVCAPSLVLDEKSVIEVARLLLNTSRGFDFNQELSYSEVSSWWWETLAERKNDEVTFWDDFIEGEKKANNYPWISATESITLSYQPENSEVLDRVLSRLNALTGCSVENLLVATWSLLVSRWSLDSKLVVGEVLDGRCLPELETILGQLSRIVPLQLQVDDESTFIDLTNKIGDLREEAREFQDYFYLDNIFSGQKNDFFPFQFQFREYMDIPHSKIVDRYSDFEPCLARLVVDIEESHMKILLQYDQQNLSSCSAELIMLDMTEILSKVTEKHSSTIKDLLASVPFVFKNNSDYLNTTFQNQTVSSAWNHQVSENWNQLALVDGVKKLSYEDLDIKSDALAQRLQKEGVEAGDVVILKTPKSSDSIVAILAIQKLEAAYLPLAPDLPSKYCEMIEEESGACLTLIMTNDEFVIKPGAHPQRMALADCPLDRTAYVIYTSGSTGKAKGVLVSQRAIMDLVDSLKKTVYQSHTQPIAIALLASLSFDASIQQIYAALLCGNTLVIVPDEEKRESQKVIRHLQENQVTFFDCTPSLLSILVEDPSFSELEIKGILVGGERLESSLAAKLFSCGRCRETVLWNVYGLTECGVDSTYMKIDTEFLTNWGEALLPIGHPLPHSCILLLDRTGRPVPEGIPGELYIGGSGLASGYLNAPALNEQLFLKSQGLSKSNVFKTGDYGCFKPDGLYHFLGRIDSQVKVRGFRIDLLEIKNACLRTNIASAVEVFVDEEDHNLIIAIVCLKDSFTLEELRERIRQELPEYMIPGRLLSVERIPLNTNGKVDIKLLQNQINKEGREKVLPQNEMEVGLLKIFSTLLNQPLSLTDNIINCGAHSLLILQAIIKINKEFGQQVDFDVVYNHSTVAALVTYLQENRKSTRTKRIRPLREKNEHGRNIFLLPSVLGTSSIFSTIKFNPDWNPWGLEYKNSDNQIENSIEDLAIAMHREITAVDQSQDIILIGYSMGAYVSYEVARLLKKEGKNPGLILIDCHVNPSSSMNLIVDNRKKKEEPLDSMKEELCPLVKKFQLKNPLLVSIVALEAQGNPVSANMTEWTEYASIFSHYLIPGDHDTLLSAEYSNSLSTILQKAMAQLVSSSCILEKIYETETKDLSIF